MPIPNLTRLAPQLTVLEVGGLTIWFSYTTPVAFAVGGARVVVSENVWSVTTGKHLKMIDGGDKARRLPYAEFARLLDAATASLPATTRPSWAL